MTDSAVARPLGHRASAAVSARIVGGRSVLTTLRCAPPLTFRPTPDGLVWVGTAAGPIGGDQLRLDVDIGDGAALRLTSAGASVALPGPRAGRSRLDIDVTVGAGASLTWYPEPLIVTARADHEARTTIRLAADADLVWVDEVVLGRHEEPAGQLRSSLRVEAPAGPLLCTGFDTTRPGWNGPAGAGGGRCVAQVVLAGRPGRALADGPPLIQGDGTTWRLAGMALADDAGLVTVAGSSTLAVRRAVAQLVAAIVC